VDGLKALDPERPIREADITAGPDRANGLNRYRDSAHFEVGS
jgi:hypothetical protein